MPDVSYTVLLDDVPLPPHVQGAMQQLQVEDHATMADVLRFRALVAVKENGDSWSVLDDDLFTRLANIKVIVAVAGITTHLIDAHIVDTRIELSSTPGKSFIDVIAMDPTVLMSLDEKQRAWPNQSDSDIAGTIFGEYGFTADVEDTRIRYDENDVTTTQFGTDIKFLKALAGRNGFECFVDLDENGNKVGHFHKPRVQDAPQGVLSVNCGAATNVNTFTARFDMLKPMQAVAAGLDIESKDNQDGSVSGSDLKSMGSSSSATGDRPRRVYLANTGLAKSSELSAYAQALVDESNFAIVAEGELNTVAYGAVLRAKKVVNVRGAGRTFSGAYYVDKVLHVLTGEGYVQRFSLRRNATGLVGRENFAEDNGLPS